MLTINSRQINTIERFQKFYLDSNHFFFLFRKMLEVTRKPPQLSSTGITVKVLAAVAICRQHRRRRIPGAQSKAHSRALSFYENGRKNTIPMGSMPAPANWTGQMPEPTTHKLFVPSPIASVRRRRNISHYPPTLRHRSLDEHTWHKDVVKNYTISSSIQKYQ